ncbi:plasmid replication protein [Clostridium perfringens]|uniref:plasmid replication protein n=1 Tax=Clostridium perfringens TaxID=1502 RepID=UPI000F8CF17A|nr:plasmid replication protein [Clostridium perfringens]RUR35117.1 plasmid replication protein [Clostridium perfringens]
MSAYHFLTQEEWEKEKEYNLTEEQFAALEQIEYKESRRKSQSIMRFLKKSIMVNGGSWSISFKNFCKAYNNWVNKKKKKRPELKNVKITQFKFLINRLRDLGLISISIVNRKNVYTLVPTEKPTEEKVPETIEITNLEQCNVTPMLSGNNIDIDLYSNSNNEFDSSKYEKCTSFVDVRNKVRELLKACRVKSKWIKDRVLVKVSKAYRNITVKFLENYILKAIEDAINTYKKNWIKYTNVTVKPVREANFTQREYDYDVLEEQLLAHY